MPTYVIHNTHAETDCSALMEAIKREPWSKQLTGRDFYCGCPFGTHEGFLAVEAETPEQALAMVDSKFRAGARVIESITGKIGEHELLPVS